MVPPKKIMEYRNLGAMDPDYFIEELNRLAESGWEPMDNTFRCTDSGKCIMVLKRKRKTLR